MSTLELKLVNNSNDSGLLIYNKVSKASSTTVASYMFKFAAKNNFTHKHIPFGQHYMTKTQEKELTFLKNHYNYSKKPFSCHSLEIWPPPPGYKKNNLISLRFLKLPHPKNFGLATAL